MFWLRNMKNNLNCTRLTRGLLKYTCVLFLLKTNIEFSQFVSLSFRLCIHPIATIITIEKFIFCLSFRSHIFNDLTLKANPFRWYRGVPIYFPAESDRNLMVVNYHSKSILPVQYNTNLNVCLDEFKIF